MNDPYHPGERAVQHRMGQADQADRMVGMVRSAIPSVGAAFLAEQPMVVVAAADEAGRVWASPITGQPGFAHTADDHTVVIEALPAPVDPLSGVLRQQCRIGMTAVDLRTRRRMRVNGQAEPLAPSGAGAPGIRIHAEQVFSTCPRYITRREVERLEAGPHSAGRRTSVTLDARQRRMISTADTFFIGSADTTGDADAANRGGNPGFVSVCAADRLRWPDYNGNALFGTLGNIYRNPRCGLLFLDWNGGATLQLTGTAELLWDTPDSPPGAQCVIGFTIVEAIEIPGASPLRWGEAELSPHNPVLRVS